MSGGNSRAKSLASKRAQEVWRDLTPGRLKRRAHRKAVRGQQRATRRKR